MSDSAEDIPRPGGYPHRRAAPRHLDIPGPPRRRGQPPRVIYNNSNARGFPRPCESPPGSDSEGEDDDDDDDICSIRSLSPVSDGEIDWILREDELADRRPGGDGPPPPPLGGRAGGGSSPDEFERDPWNAVAVVGLRIYYKVPQGEEEQVDGEGLVKLRVVRPNRWEIGDDEEEDDDDEEGEKGEGDGGVEGEVDESMVLDVDDSAKDAVVKRG